MQSATPLVQIQHLSCKASLFITHVRRNCEQPHPLHMYMSKGISMPCTSCIMNAKPDTQQHLGWRSDRHSAHDCVKAMHTPSSGLQTQQRLNKNCPCLCTAHVLDQTHVLVPLQDTRRRRDAHKGLAGGDFKLVVLHTPVCTCIDTG